MKPAIIYCLLALLVLLGCAGPDAPATKSGTVKMKDAEIYYEPHGKGEPLLLLHAGFLNVDMWRNQVSELAKHYQVITIDLPGHGKTTTDTVRVTPPYFLATLLDSLHLAKVFIAGVSVGASCVTDFIIAHPERVNKAILVSSGIVGWENTYGSDTMIKQFISSFFTSLDQKDTAAAAEGFTKFWFDGPFRTPQQVNDTARRYIYESTLYNLKTHALGGWPLFADSMAIDHLPEIRVPVLVIDGDKDAPHIGKTCAYLQQNIPGAKRITIPGTGHMLNMEAPAEFNKAVLEFLKK